MKIFEKVSPTEVIRSHFATLYDHSRSSAEHKKIMFSEIIVFYLAPIIGLPVLCIHFKEILNTSFIEILFQGFAIIGGFFINALIMITDRRKLYTDEKKYAARVTKLHETFANTAFGVLISFTVLVISAIYIAVPLCMPYSAILSGIVYALCIWFLHTLAMVIKRLNRILKD